MSDEEDPKEEPSMEEILASIRRIISEDTEGVNQAVDPKEGVKEEQNSIPEAKADLGGMSFDAVSVDDEPEEGFGDKVISETQDEDVFELTDVVDETDVPHVGDPIKIVSNETGSLAGSSFSELSTLMVSGYTGSDRTLEDLVRELLKPMLKEYLDKNLPKTVEDMVEQEITRISRKYKF